jgi:hypothetical protein
MFRPNRGKRFLNTRDYFNGIFVTNLSQYLIRQVYSVDFSESMRLAVIIKVSLVRVQNPEL